MIGIDHCEAATPGLQADLALRQNDASGDASDPQLGQNRSMSFARMMESPVLFVILRICSSSALRLASTLASSSSSCSSGEILSGETWDV